MKRISKKTRDQAILICAIAASNPDLRSAYATIRRQIGGRRVHGAAKELAIDAWSAVWDLSEGLFYVDAEAAALLADGWSPGDPVEVL